MKSVFLLTAFLCFGLSAGGQTPSPTPASPELPSPPLLRPPPDFSQWEINFSYGDEKQTKHKSGHKAEATPAASTARLRKIVTTKTGRIVHVELIDVLGQSADIWYDAGTQYSKSAGQALWYQVAKTPTDLNYRPLPAIGYSDMELVKADNYAGNTSYDKRDCLVFIAGGYHKLNLNNARDAQKKLKSVDSIAYIDAESRLPVAVTTSDDSRTFQFDPPPTKMQVLPIDLVQQIKKGQDANARFGQPAAKPY